ncbi:hypothetical protein [Dyadobacter sp. 3J3]|nr:hypothetical protein [Dyadobacter sp. 3J3]
MKKTIFLFVTLLNLTLIMLAKKEDLVIPKNENGSVADLTEDFPHN